MAYRSNNVVSAADVTNGLCALAMKDGRLRTRCPLDAMPRSYRGLNMKDGRQAHAAP